MHKIDARMAARIIPIGLVVLLCACVRQAEFPPESYKSYSATPVGPAATPVGPAARVSSPNQSASSVGKVYYSAKELEHFYKIAFGSNSSKAKLRKWRVNPRLNIVGEVPVRFWKATREAVNAINQQIKGVNVKFGGVGANVQIHFVYRERFAEFISRRDRKWLHDKFGVCSWRDFSSSGRQQAIIVVDRNRKPAEVEKTLVHELMHMMGFSGHSNSKDSVLYVKGSRPFHELTSLDRKALQLLYQPSLAAGMTQAQVKKKLSVPNRHYY